MTRYLLFVCLLSFLAEGILSQISPLQVQTNARFFEIQTIYPKAPSNKSNPPGWNLFDGFPDETSNDSRYLNRSSNSLLSAGLKYDKQFDRIDVNLEMDLVKRNETKGDLLYTGKNNFIRYNLNDYFIGVGKRQFFYRESPFIGYSDGGEGLFVEKNFNRKWKFQIFFWDHYRGYRLLEKEYLSPDHFTGKEIEIQKGQRRRHSFGFVFEDFLKLTMGISYIEFGTFGRHTKEVNTNVTKYGADGDSALMGNCGAKFDFRYFYTNIEVLWTKGIDRSMNKMTTTPGSILIEGEALSLGFGYADSFLKYGIALQISDREERNSQNQVVKLGFMNTGTHPGSTYFLSQYLQMFPSSYFSQNGLERNQTILRGHPQSSYGEIFFSVHLFDIFMKLTAAMILPYKASGKSDGKISFQKESYENFYLAEFSYDLAYKNDQSQIGITISYLHSPSFLNIQGTMIQGYGSILF
jgi:hypothetical protein